MKTVKFIGIIFLLIIFNNEIFSQTCESCRITNYPYLGCCMPDFKRCNRCLNDPLNQNDDFKPYKKCNLSPGVIDYDATTCPFASFYWNDNTLPNSYQYIFEITHTDDHVYLDLSDWAAICSSINQIDCDDCDHIKIFWDRDARDMGEHPNSLAIFPFCQMLHLTASDYQF
jgi:hypothetical protein